MTFTKRFNATVLGRAALYAEVNGYTQPPPASVVFCAFAAISRKSQVHTSRMLIVNIDKMGYLHLTRQAGQLQSELCRVGLADLSAILLVSIFGFETSVIEHLLILENL